MANTTIETGIKEKKESNFWTGKSPCWEVSRCTNMIKAECPAFRYQFQPCWEIEGTYCKLNDFGTDGKDTSICQICRVYKAYGEEQPISIKLIGRGISTSLAGIAQSVIV
jgi:hypothetical protein